MKITDAARILGGTCLACSLALQPAFAQGTGTPADSTEGTFKLDEVVVTAQKREENLQRTPLAVSAITTKALEQRGIVDVSHLTSLAPTLTTTTTPGSTSSSTIAIRAIGNGDPILTSDSPVSLYVDGVVIGRQAGAAFDLLDLERIEILRGPQGTLYGRNTIGGAVNLITAKPADKFGIKEKLSFGNWNQWQTRTSVDTGQWGESGIRAKLTYVHREQAATSTTSTRRAILIRVPPSSMQAASPSRLTVAEPSAPTTPSITTSVRVSLRPGRPPSPTRP